MKSNVLFCSALATTGHILITTMAIFRRMPGQYLYLSHAACGHCQQSIKEKKLPLFDRTTVSPFSIHSVNKHRALEVIHLWILHAANGTINWRERKKRLKSELDYWLAINNNVRMRMSKRTIVHFISRVFLCAVSSLFFVPLSF